MKINVTGFFGAMVLLSSLAFATEQEQNYLKSQWFLEKLLISKGARFELNAYNKVITLYKADCEIKLEENIMNYSTLSLRKTFNNTITHESIRIEPSSTLVLTQSNSIVDSIKIEELRAFDCEEEGCSQETTLVQNISSTKIELQDVYQGPNYGYSVLTTSCDL